MGHIDLADLFWLICRWGNQDSKSFFFSKIIGTHSSSQTCRRININFSYFYIKTCVHVPHPPEIPHPPGCSIWSGSTLIAIHPAVFSHISSEVKWTYGKELRCLNILGKYCFPILLVNTVYLTYNLKKSILLPVDMHTYHKLKTKIHEISQILCEIWQNSVRFS